jgi:SPP1 family predicted phage head-tail adaptor
MRDAGILTLYNLTSTSAMGDAPVEKLVEVGTAFYAEKTVGYNRIYAARGANEQIDTVVRCYNTDVPYSAKYVILEDGEQYQISVKQKIVDEDATDLTLVRLEDYYDVASN